MSAPLPISGTPAGAAGTSRPGTAEARSKFSVAFIGLCVFTLSIVTARVPFGELGVFIALFGLAIQRERLRCPGWVWAFALFVAWAFVGVPFSIAPSVAMDAAVERLKILAVALIAVNAIRNWAQLRWYLVFLVACFILFPARGALVNYFGGYSLFGRAIWGHIYGNPNDLATYSILALGPALVLTFSRAAGNRLRLAAAACAGILVLVILLTQSRGAFLGLAIGMAFPLLLAVWKLPRGRLAVGLAVVAMLAAIPAATWERLAGIAKLTSADTIADADREGSAAQRFQIQKTGLEIFTDQPILGVGIGAYRAANALYAPEIGAKDTHNTYLNLAAETGLPGLVLWVGMAFAVLSSSRRSRRGGLAPEALEFVWIERALICFLIASVFGTYSVVSLPYLMLAVLWLAATLNVSSRPPVVGGLPRRPH